MLKDYLEHLGIEKDEATCTLWKNYIEVVRRKILHYLISS
jgi:hypothetical protein